jgi:hypothetical protein
MTPEGTLESSVKQLLDAGSHQGSSVSNDRPRFFVIDGATLALQPTRELRQAFPPASNQHGRGVWPIVNMAVAHELETACALRPVIGPMYGPQAVSETRLACQCVERLPDGSCVMADSGFSIFFFADYCRQHGHPFFIPLNR